MTTKKKIIEELRKTIGTFEDSFGFNGTIEELADSILGLVKQEIVEEIEKMKRKVILRGGNGEEFDAEQEGLSLGSISKGYNQAISDITQTLNK